MLPKIATKLIVSSAVLSITTMTPSIVSATETETTTAYSALTSELSQTRTCMTPAVPGLEIPEGIPSVPKGIDVEKIAPAPDEILNILLDHCKANNNIADLARSFDAMAKIYDEHNQSNDAEVCYLIAIQLLHQTLGKNDPELATEFERLSIHYAHTGMGELARKANLQAVQIFKANGKEFAVELAVIDHNQAWLELYAGRTSTAEKYLHKCLKLLQTTLGQRDALVGIVSCSLADLYIYSGQLVKAQQLLKSALSILPESEETDELCAHAQANYDVISNRLRHSHEKLVHGQLK